MPACALFEPLIAERAAGGPEPLSPADAARLDAHLAGCAHCRAEADAYARALGLARLPAVSPAEERPLAQLPAAVRAGLRQRPGWLVVRRFLALGFAAAAIVVLVANKVILPSARRAPPASPAAAWAEPDVDALLARVDAEHAELASASADEPLALAERAADAAYARAIAGGE